MPQLSLREVASALFRAGVFFLSLSTPSHGTIALKLGTHSLVGVCRLCEPPDRQYHWYALALEADGSLFRAGVFFLS